MCNQCALTGFNTHPQEYDPTFDTVATHEPNFQETVGMVKRCSESGCITIAAYSMPNTRMNLTGIPLRSIPAGYPQRSAACLISCHTKGRRIALR